MSNAVADQEALKLECANVLRKIDQTRNPHDRNSVLLFENTKRLMDLVNGRVAQQRALDAQFLRQVIASIDDPAFADVALKLARAFLTQLVSDIEDPERRIPTLVTTPSPESEDPDVRTAETA